VNKFLIRSIYFYYKSLKYYRMNLKYHFLMWISLFFIIFYTIIIFLLILSGSTGKRQQNQEISEDEEFVEDDRFNILFAIADDMSWLHTSFSGCEAIQTPYIDYLARNGVWFNHAYCSAPSCSASRASVLTGRNGFELREGACLWSIIPSEFKTYTEYLEESGYFTGYTGKGWGPGDWEDSGRKKNPAGKGYQEVRTIPYEQLGDSNPMSNVDYAANFAEFLRDRPVGKPFCFWYGAFEPHRDYLKDIGLMMGKQPDDIDVPDFLPDVPEVRHDILDYLVEIEWFDHHLGKMIGILREEGELDNTLIVVTSDNGMPFPRAKSNLYEYGTHMPLVIFCKKLIPGGREIDDLVSLTDLAPTFLEVADLPVPEEMSGKSLLDILNSNISGQADPSRNRIFTFRERHAWVQPDGQIYPMRAMRKNQFLIIWNPKPDMYPAGHPDPQYNFNYYPYGDVDNSPTKDFLLSLQKKEAMRWYYDLAWAKRPEFELYNLADDSFQVKNLAGMEEYDELLFQLQQELKNYLDERGDLRMKGQEAVYFKAPYYANKGFDSGGLSPGEWEKLTEEEKKMAIEKGKKRLEENMEKLESLGWELN
jgi:N-sulfoglucosamine sulfohydrolase